VVRRGGWMETAEKKTALVGGRCRKKRLPLEFTHVYVESEGLRRSRRFFINLHKRLIERVAQRPQRSKCHIIPENSAMLQRLVEYGLHATLGKILALLKR
uniref:Uncharacterized protein n=1 Tax=Parascaris univalens TaxID=6257 RepID=A0A915AWP6_PARUN